MSLRIYNSLSRKKEPYKSVENGKIKMYVCGMTVYSDVHIGHARTYLAFDIIRRYFEYLEYDVLYVQNITDVDDKIIAAANKEGIDAIKYSERFAERCLNDLDDLGIRRADLYPKASETIPDMIGMIQQILDKGFGYVADGDVYFSVDKFKEYGKLSGQQIDEMLSGARIAPGEKKQKSSDFALWKQAKAGEPSWDSPWGKGRPGWHIECSTMSSKYLGIPFDIHGGGMDLRFPHHENEIAQAEAATGKDFAKYWMHIGLLTIDGEKMSKSIGNIINVKELMKTWDSEVIRMFFAQAHYRSPPDFSKKAMENTRKGLERIYRLIERLDKRAESKSTLDESTLTQNEKNYLTSIREFTHHFEEAMNDDFNTPEAVALIFDFVNTSNRFLEKNEQVDAALCNHALEQLVKLGSILTLFQPKKVQPDESELLASLQTIVQKYQSIQSNSIEEIIKTLIDIREEARNQKNWKVADEIRNELQGIGIEVQDTSTGPVWKKRL
jgi:cysteinyl-tRNA synthetase